MTHHIQRLISKVMQRFDIQSPAPKDLKQDFTLIEDIDDDLGAFKYSKLEDSWFYDVDVTNIGIVKIVGDSRRPKAYEKKVLHNLLPQLEALSSLVKKSLKPPTQTTKLLIPEDLTLDRLILHSADEVELYFNPGVDIPNDFVWPMATLSTTGELLKTEWIT